MNNSRISIVAILLLGALLLPACAKRNGTLHPGSLSRITLGPRDVRLTKIAEGKDCEKVILGIQTASPSYYDAQQAGLQSAGAEMFLDEISYDGVEKGLFFPNLLAFFSSRASPFIILYGDHCRYVAGHGINRR